MEREPLLSVSTAPTLLCAMSSTVMQAIASGSANLETKSSSVSNSAQALASDSEVLSWLASPECAEQRIRQMGPDEMPSTFHALLTQNLSTLITSPVYRCAARTLKALHADFAMLDNDSSLDWKATSKQTTDETTADHRNQKGTVQKSDEGEIDSMRRCDSGCWNKTKETKRKPVSESIQAMPWMQIERRLVLPQKAASVQEQPHDCSNTTIGEIDSMRRCDSGCWNKTKETKRKPVSESIQAMPWMQIERRLVLPQKAASVQEQPHDCSNTTIGEIDSMRRCDSGCWNKTKETKRKPVSESIQAMPWMQIERRLVLPQKAASVQEQPHDCSNTTIGERIVPLTRFSLFYRLAGRPLSLYTRGNDRSADNMVRAIH
jgi:hypothetical protein